MFGGDDSTGQGEVKQKAQPLTGRVSEVGSCILLCIYLPRFQMHTMGTVRYCCVHTLKLILHLMKCPWYSCNTVSSKVSFVFFSLSQHNPRPDRPGQPTARTGLPEKRRRTLYSFRQMDKSAQHSQPSNCQQAHMMACSRQGKRHASNTVKLCFCAVGFFQ